MRADVVAPGFATLMVTGSLLSSAYPVVGLVSLAIGAIWTGSMRWSKRPPWAADAALVSMFAAVIFAAVVRASSFMCVLSSCAIVVAWDIDRLAHDLAVVAAPTQLRILQRSHLRVASGVVGVSVTSAFVATNTHLQLTWPRVAIACVVAMGFLFRVDKMLRQLNDP
jgi:hypothetical protein